MSHRLMIFCWHNLRSSHCFPQPDGVGIEGFERQLRRLCRIGSPVPLLDALVGLRSGRSLPRGAFAVTFDDGYRDNLELAAPILDRLDVPATAFLVPGILSGEIRPWWEHLAWAFNATSVPRLDWEDMTYPLTTDHARRTGYADVAERVKRRTRQERDVAIGDLVDALAPAGAAGDQSLFLDWEGAGQLAALGWDIGSHSRYHSILSRQPPADQREDLRESRSLLERRLGTEVKLLSYPNGTKDDFDEITIGAAKEAGYDHAVTTIAGRIGVHTPPYELERYVMYPEQGTGYFARLATDGLHRRAARYRRAFVTMSKTSATSAPRRGMSNRAFATA